MENKNKIILDLCGGTGSWSKPYKNAGYDVRVLTLPDFDVTQWWHYQDIYDLVVSGNVYGILAAPPCTMFSRARTTGKTPRDFREAMRVVNACMEIVRFAQYENHFYLKFWALENPVGHLQRFLGRPPFKFQPYDFGDRHSKETCIWGYFNEPKKNPVKLTEEEILKSRNNTRVLPKIPLEYVKDKKMKDVQIRKSMTPEGFANAFFKANQ